MGMTSDWAIEIHNELMDTDENYASDYFARMWEMELHESYTDGDGCETATDWRLDALTGYMEFICPLCGEYADNDFAHASCVDEERARDAAASEYYAEDLAWRYLEEVW